MPVALLNKMIRTKPLPLLRRRIKTERNLSFLDRAVRIGGGLVLIGLGVKRHSGLAGKALSLFGGALLFEGIASYSPVYDWLDFSSRSDV